MDCECSRLSSSTHELITGQLIALLIEVAVPLTESNIVDLGLSFTDIEGDEGGDIGGEVGGDIEGELSKLCVDVRFGLDCTCFCLINRGGVFILGIEESFGISTVQRLKEFRL